MLWGLRDKFYLFVQDLIARPIYVGDHRALVTSIFGDRFYVDTRDRSVSLSLMTYRFWESAVTRVLRKSVGPGGVVIDVGANLGWHTVMMAKRAGPAGRVTAFEANPAMVELLGRNVQINDVTDRVEVVSKAVYSQTGPMTFQVYGELMGGSSFYGKTGTATRFHDTVRAVEVQAIRLDDHFPPGTKIDLIHADVEGSEPHVVRGARRVIADNRQIVLLIEYSPLMLRSSGIAVRDFNTELREMGFRPYRITSGGRLSATSYEALETGGHCDIVLRRPDR